MDESQGPNPDQRFCSARPLSFAQEVRMLNQTLLLLMDESQGPDSNRNGIALQAIA